MGLFNFIKSQLIDVIEWTDHADDIMVYRFPMDGKEIMMGAKLTVRESQAAVFVNEGQIADVFHPGLYELTTSNMPVLTKLKSWKYGFNSPFKAEVYFVNTRQFTNQKWGTANPVMMRDPEFGMLRLRAYGIFSFRVTDPAVFLKEVFGTRAEFSVDGIVGQLRKKVVTIFSDTLGEANIPALDLAAQYRELGAMLMGHLRDDFGRLGLGLASLYIENISLPEEVEKAIDARSRMGVLGDLGRYTQLQTADAIGDIAKKEGGGQVGGVDMAGIGVGMGVGQTIAQNMTRSMNNDNSQQNVNPAQEQIQCPSCGHMHDRSSKFCPECGAPRIKKCTACGADVGTAKFCPECGAKQ